MKKTVNSSDFSEWSEGEEMFFPLADRSKSTTYSHNGVKTSGGSQCKLLTWGSKCNYDSYDFDKMQLSVLKIRRLYREETGSTIRGMVRSKFAEKLGFSSGPSTDWQRKWLKLVDHRVVDVFKTFELWIKIAKSQEEARNNKEKEVRNNKEKEDSKEKKLVFKKPSGDVDRIPIHIGYTRLEVDHMLAKLKSELMEEIKFRSHSKINRQGSFQDHLNSKR